MAYEKDSAQVTKVDSNDMLHNEDIGVLAESVQYGQAGIRGVLKSPYVLGAAFLASTGGFSWVSRDHRKLS